MNKAVLAKVIEHGLYKVMIRDSLITISGIVVDAQEALSFLKRKPDDGFLVVGLSRKSKKWDKRERRAMKKLMTIAVTNYGWTKSSR